MEDEKMLLKLSDIFYELYLLTEDVPENSFEVADKIHERVVQIINAILYRDQIKVIKRIPECILFDRGTVDYKLEKQK
jgi:hypothetical protein